MTLKENFYKKFHLKGNFEFIDEEFDSRLSEDLKTLGFSSSYQHMDFQHNLGGRYDFAVEEMAKTSIRFRFFPWVMAISFKSGVFKTRTRENFYFGNL